MTVYMLVLAGAPIFANFKAGFGALLDPTGGFIIAFIIVAYVSGKLVEQKKDPLSLHLQLPLSLELF